MLLRLLRNTFKRRRAPAELRELALAHHARGELDRAEALFREIVSLDPSDVSAWSSLSATLLARRRYQDAIPVLREVIEMQPDLAEAHLDLGVCLTREKNNAEAIRHYLRAIELKPGLSKAHANLINAYLDCCDWDAVERWSRSFLEYRSTHPVQEWGERLDSFCALSLFPGEITRELAVFHASRIESSVGAEGGRSAPAAAGRGKGRIRVGYVSSDFYSHATAHLTLSLYENHDRCDFEIHAYSFGPDDGSASRRHIERTCDRFVDVAREAHAATAARIRADGIDILVDLNGYTAGARPQIFARRPAPVQVSYLGYPATSGARYMDYFVTDRVSTPAGAEGEFTESLVFMPDCYQVNDNTQPVPSAELTRADCGLPADGFVYCCFNTLRKIDARIFGVWMEILRRVPGSVLWLVGEDPQGEDNLRREAGQRGVDPGRLFFAKKVDMKTHLARHLVADLFLDTWIYNAHTSGSHALWAGLPLVTCPGESFARRVGASLLSAAGLPELVTRSLEEYAGLAVRLALEPDLLAGIRGRLARDRMSCALFDTQKYVRHLEAAYRQMLEIHRRGEQPQSFAVAAR